MARPGGLSAFTQADLRQLASFLAEAARAEILPRFRNLGDGAVRTKTSTIDLVTDADEAAERLIGARIGAAFPGAIVIGEEATGRDPALLDALDYAELAVLVDPVDGTKNFASGLPLFGVMAAVVSRGEVIAGAIHDPLGGDVALALRGQGAWIERDGGARTPLCVAPPVPLGEMEGIIGTTYLPEPLRSTVNGNLARLATSAYYRCAAHEYRMAAGGHCHVLLYNKLMPWDHAAGWLLHREAGGYAAHFDGTPYRPTRRTGGLICAPDEASWHVARDGLLTPSA
ncbi:inositol monophosphatase family protein [Desertibaculum subflavum]|uniref:inositol monophosphatase family protein n=1 Tax=Desertibaculum subflavum TaxID=2268458 RepID=UPI000E672A8A